MAQSAHPAPGARTRRGPRSGAIPHPPDGRAVATFRWALAERRILAVNDTATEQYGWSRDQFLRMHADDLRAPEDIDRFHRMLEWLESHGQRPLGGCHVTRHRRRDGSLVDVEVSWSAVSRKTDPTAWTFVRPLEQLPSFQDARVRQLSTELAEVKRASTAAAAMRAAAGAARRLVDAQLVVIALEAPREKGAPPEVPPRAVSLPLSGKDSEEIGRLVVVRARQDTDEGSAALDVVAQSAACWLSVDRLQREARSRDPRASARALVRRVATAREDERAHIARELHDGLGGLLTGARLVLDARADSLAQDEERRTEALRLVAEAIHTVRDLSHALRPLDLEERGLRAALEDQVARWRRRGGLGVRIEYRGRSGPLPPTVALIAFRVVQEGLTNVARHAGQTDVVVRVSETPRMLTVEVDDRGAGFDPKLARSLDGSGLRGLRERVRHAGGRFAIVSSPGHGTHITATIPLRPARARRGRRAV